MLSIIIPFHNEEKNITELHRGLTTVLNKMRQEYEIIYVNDGSTDRSLSEALSFGKKDPHTKVVSLRAHFGKGKALTEGIQSSRGSIIIFMDADLQDDPKDLPRFIKKIDDGYDLVNGWRRERKDGLIKTLPSYIGNQIILKLLLHSKFHDVNCGYKAIKRQILEEIRLYGDNFRFLPVIAEKSGFKTEEVTVAHNPRKHGKSKFGFFRRFTIFADILSTYFIYQFSEKPLHFFGPIGGLTFLIGFLITTVLLIQRIFFGVLLYRRPALPLAILLIIVGIQIVMTGIIGELIAYLHRKK